MDGSPEMEAVSVKLKLSAALIAKLKGVNAADNQMEQTFSETLSRYFRIDQVIFCNRFYFFALKNSAFLSKKISRIKFKKNIIILRLKCAENLTSDDGSIEESDHDLIIQVCDRCQLVIVIFSFNFIKHSVKNISLILSDLKEYEKICFGKMDSKKYL